MVRLEKMYFSLREVAKRWGVRKLDLAYMAENAMLRVSVHLIGVHLERGRHEVDGGQALRIITDRTMFTGLLDLKVRDAVAAFRTGETEVAHFQADENEYAALIEPTTYTVVKAKHLVIWEGRWNIRPCERPGSSRSGGAISRRGYALGPVDRSGGGGCTEWSSTVASGGRCSLKG